MGSKIEFDTDQCDLIQAIQAGAGKPELLADVKPGSYTTEEVHRVPDVPLSKTLRIYSLSGVVDYLSGELDSKVKTAESEVFIHVESPVEVNVYQGNYILDSLT